MRSRETRELAAQLLAMAAASLTAGFAPEVSTTWNAIEAVTGLPWGDEIVSGDTSTEGKAAALADRAILAVIAEDGRPWFELFSNEKAALYAEAEARVRTGEFK